VKAEGQLLKMAALAEQVQGLQSAVEDKDSLITRMRSEQQVCVVNILRPVYTYSIMYRRAYFSNVITRCATL
jgi:hypothetical protein